MYAEVDYINFEPYDTVEPPTAETALYAAVAAPVNCNLPYDSVTDRLCFPSDAVIAYQDGDEEVPSELYETAVASVAPASLPQQPPYATLPVVYIQR